jgi:FtsZ-binding cell division protein ZapB
MSILSKAELIQYKASCDALQRELDRVKAENEQLKQRMENAQDANNSLMQQRDELLAALGDIHSRQAFEVDWVTGETNRIVEADFFPPNHEKVEDQSSATVKRSIEKSDDFATRSSKSDSEQLPPSAF